MQFSAEHRQLADTIYKIIQQDINPYAEEWEREGIFPAHELYKKLGNAGLLGMNRSPQYGGAGLDFSYNLVMAETLGEVDCPAVAMAIGVHTDMATPSLARFGSEKLKQEFLAPSIAGDRVACLGVSEVGAGSDVASIKTSAKIQGDDLIINGAKMWITTSTQADWMCLLANTSEGPFHKNKSLICVPMDAKGISLGKPLNKLGMRSSDTAQVFFDQVKIPKDHVIGELNHGFRYQMLQFQEERMWASANILRSMEKLIRATIEYTTERKTFDTPLINRQVVHFTLAELQTEIEALRALVYRALEHYLQDQDVTYLASMAKLKAGRLARQVADQCLQFWGGMGFMWESLPSRCYRDWRLLSIGAGADEVMLNIICKKMEIL